MSPARIHHPDAPRGLIEALAGAGVEAGEIEQGLVFVQRTEGLEDFDTVREELVESFRLTKQAAAAGAPIVYVVCYADLMGQRGPLRAMLANGLLSAARSMGMEGLRGGRTANAVAFDEGSEAGTVAPWVAALLGTSDVTGEIVTIGPRHLGKVIP